MKALTISQIRAYSYKANGYAASVFSSSSVASCTSDTPLNLIVASSGTTAGLLKDNACYNQNRLSGIPQVKYYSVAFDTVRYVQKVTILGDIYTANWILSVGN